MNKYLPLAKIKLFKPPKKVRTGIDKISFKHIFLIWMIFIIAVGFIYFFFQTPTSKLIFSETGETAGLLDSIYFSFISATSTGFGDIIPIGNYKILSILEVIVSLTMFALVTSKLVSLKQTAILDEIYDISFSDRVDKIRSSLYLYRIDLDKIMVKMDEKSIKKREISEIWMNFSFFENTLNEFTSLINREHAEKSYLKTIDPVNMQIILNSINQSFTKLEELLHLFVENKIDWKKTLTVNFIQSCLEHANIIFKKIEASYSPQIKNVKEVLDEFNEREETIMQLVK